VPRYHPGPPPDRSDLAGLPLHVLVRDWAELDPLLRAAGVDLEAAGHLTLGEALGASSPGTGARIGVGAPAGGHGGLESMMDEIAAATRWRAIAAS